MNTTKACFAFFALAAVYFEQRAQFLEEKLYRAEYFVQSGLASVRSVCSSITFHMRRRELDGLVHELGTVCLGMWTGEKELAYRRLLNDTRSPEIWADAIDKHLRTERRLPYVGVEPVRRDLMPAQYLDGTPIVRSDGVLR